MLAMYCPSIREQMVRQKQHLQHLLARRRILSPVIRPFENWNISEVYGLSSYAAYPEHVTHYNSLQVEFAESQPCSAVKGFLSG